MVGKTVAHFEILRRLGGGGMGVVYKARDRRLHRFVALKFLPPEVGSDAAARARFRREATAASALEHGNICTVHEIGETEDGQLYICMAYYEGETLAARLARGRLSERQALDVLAQVGAGLRRAHEAGIVHRDVKPANVMLTSHGEVRLLDFGLASLLGSSPLTRPGTVMGTVAYMSPEQVRGEPLDERTDLWSLGVILYEMIAGKLPFPGESAAGVMQAILHREPDPLPADAAVSPRVAELLTRLLAKDPADRGRSVSELDEVAAAPGRQTESATLTALGPTTRRPRSTPLVRRWALVVPVVVLLLGVVAAGRWWWPEAAPPVSPGSVAVLPFANLTGDPTKDYLSEGIAAGLITRLGEVTGLRVVGRSEILSYLERQLTTRELSRELGFEIYVEGAVAEAGERLRVPINLVSAEQGRVLWSREQEWPGDRLPAVPREIAEELVEVLSISLSDRERRRLERDSTRSFQAYDAYLQGRHLLDDFSDESNVDAALARFQQAVQIDPGFALAHAGQSEGWWRKSRRQADPGLLEEARRAAARALELDPGLPAGQLAMARVLRSTGRAEASVEQLRDLLERHPKPDEAYRELAFSFERLGNLEEAGELLRIAVVLEGDDWRNWNDLGAFRWRLGEYDAAREAFEQAVEASPPSISTARANLAALEISQGRADAAVAAYETIPAEAVQNAVLASNIGTAYYFSEHPRKWEKAEEFYRLAVRLNPRNDQVQRNLADLYITLERRDEALRHYRLALEITDERLEGDPQNPDYRLRRAFYAAKAEECATASAQAMELSAELPRTAQNQHQLAYVWALCGEREQALEALAAAVDLGVAPELIRAEEEFRGLAGDPAFEALIRPDR